MIDKFFDRIYWINTKARRDRANNMTARLAGYKNTERFEAITGNSELSNKLIKQDGLFVPHNKRRVLRAGEIGCFLSHREVWKDAKAKGYTRILILEDDAELSKDTDSIFEYHTIPENWDMLFFGQRNYDNQRNAQEKSGDTAALINHVSGTLYEAKRCWLTHAYAVNAKCIDYLLENTKTIDYPIDGVLADAQENINVYAFYPSVIFQDSTQSSLR